jgi:hypothetical protein
MAVVLVLAALVGRAVVAVETQVVLLAALEPPVKVMQVDLQVNGKLVAPAAEKFPQVLVGILLQFHEVAPVQRIP